jgi:hypothetical protein
MIKKLSLSEMGKHYGYPECCINNINSDHNNLKIRQEKYQFVYGYLPCSSCFEKLEIGCDINSILINRKCTGKINITNNLNYDDEISQRQLFLTELNLLLKKTNILLMMPYDNVLIYEQVLFIINPKRMRKKKVCYDRNMTYHNIKNIYKMRFMSNIERNNIKKLN